MNTNSLHIIKLEASNIKKLKAVSITPEGKVVIISGDNDSGKTSTIDSIAYALGGKDLIDDVPIRVGTNKAKSVVILGHDGVPLFKVTRSFSALGGTQLVIEDAAGNPVRSPQTLLDSLCVHMAFDPLSFIRIKPSEQAETLRKLVGLDFTKLDADRKRAYDERTLANRELANAKARAAEVEVDPETPDDEVSVADLMKELSEVQAFNKVNNEKRDQVGEAEKRLASWRDEAGELSKKVATLSQQLAEAQQQLKDANDTVADREKTLADYQAAAAELKDREEDPIRQKINDASTINAKVRDKKRFKQLQEEVKKAEKRAEDLTSEIEAYDAQKTKLLSEAKFPLEGLSFDDTGVLLNGVPFTQGSQARQLQAAVAIGIAMNPKVRVILIRDGSLLDQNSLAMVAKMAEESDCQVWVEVVNSGDPTAIIIEDGQVKEHCLRRK